MLKLVDRFNAWWDGPAPHYQLNLILIAHVLVMAILAALGVGDVVFLLFVPFVAVRFWGIFVRRRTAGERNP